MDRRGAGDDVTRTQPRSVVAGPVGDDSSGLPDEEPARGDVPGPEAQLEVAVEDALGGPAEVEAGPADPAQILEASASRRRRTARYLASRSLCRNGKPVAQIACAGDRSLTVCSVRSSRNAPPPRRAE